MAIVRGIAVMFDAGPDQCGAVEVATEDQGEVVTVRYLAACDRPPHLVWLGQVGMCEDHILRIWPELGEPN